MKFKFFNFFYPLNLNNFNMKLLFLFVILFYFWKSGESIRCYQCSSDDDKLTDHDNCGVYKSFDDERNIPIECQGDESVTPGTFCVKITQQSPRGFIWDGRWRQVIRRCASVSDTYVTGVCNWGVYANGVYWEECYCSEDSCNNSNYIQISVILLTIVSFVHFLLSN